jgi:ParB family chromosome partitioning protein
MAKPKRTSPDELIRCPIASIVPSPVQARSGIDDAKLEDLVASIREHGVIEPIVVTRLSEGRYEIVAGERRWRAAKLAGLTDIQAIVRAFTDAEKREIGLIENLQRADLPPLDVAAALQSLAGNGLTHAVIGQRLGKTKRWVEEHLSLLRLPAPVQALLKAEKIHKSLVRGFASLPEAEQIRLATQAAESELGSAIPRRAMGRKTRPTKGASTLELEARFARHFGVRTEIALQSKDGRGYIKLHFSSFDEFERLFEVFYPPPAPTPAL